MTILNNSKDLLDLSKEISKALKGEKDECLRLECAYGVGTYIATINMEGKIAKLASKLRAEKVALPSQGAFQVNIFALKPTYLKLNEAVALKNDQILVDLPLIYKRDIEAFRIEVKYHMDKEWLDRLVHWRAPAEPLKEATKYHLSAQLVDPNGLAMGFREVDVEDYPIEARIHIQKDISAGFPIMEALAKMQSLNDQISNLRNPHGFKDLMRLHQEQLRLQKKIEREDPTEALKQFLLLLSPQRFLDYLSTDDRDFFIHNCEWGDSFMKHSGSMAIPEMVKVITTADLSLSKFAAKGVLTYESGKFLNDISDIASKEEKKKAKRGTQHT